MLITSYFGFWFLFEGLVGVGGFFFFVLVLFSDFLVLT
jgi:hypothetical protein